MTALLSPSSFIDDIEAAMPHDSSLRDLIVVDLFAGCGGASQGLLRALTRLGLTARELRRRGWRLRLINVNHWEIAIETIKRNITFAELYNASIENVDPTFVLRGQRPHLLIAAAECIMYSQARGNKPIRDQSRTTAAWILDWVACNPYSLYFENVPEWKSWGMLDERMRPLPEHKGEYYRAFLDAIRQQGYGLAEGIVNCADYGDATTRKRLFIVGRKIDAGLPRSVQLPPPTHTKHPERFPDRKPWVPARAIIDWTRKGEPITHRKRGPHAPPTLRRIRAGYAKQDVVLRPVLLELIDRMIPIAERFHKALEERASEKALGRALSAIERRENGALLSSARKRAIVDVAAAYKTPLAELASSDLTPEQQIAFATILGQHGGATARPVSQPLPAIATGGAIGLSVPATESLIVKANASATSVFDDAVQSVDQPLRTIVTKDCRALATPTLASVQHGREDLRTADIDAPLSTVTGKGSTGLAEPVIAPLYSSSVASGSVDSIDEPLSTVVSGGNHHALAEPIVALHHGIGSGEPRCRSVDDTVATLGAGGNQHALAEPVVAMVHGAKADESRCRSVDSPIATVTGGGNQHALVEPMIVSRNNAARGENRCRSIQDPIPTATGDGAGAIAEAFIVSRNNAEHGERRPHSIDDPIPTATGRGAGAVAEAFIVPQQSVAGPRSIDLPTPTATAIARMGLAEAHITSNHFENEGATIDEPLPTATTASGGGFGVTQPFLVPNFGERPTQQPRVHNIDEPTPTVTSHGAGALVDVDLPADGPYFLLDGVAVHANILYRMLHSSELARAHNLGHVRFAGSEADAIKQVGNSIPGETAAAMIGEALVPVLTLFEEFAELEPQAA